MAQIHDLHWLKVDMLEHPEHISEMPKHWNVLHKHLIYRITALVTCLGKAALQPALIISACELILRPFGFPDAAGFGCLLPPDARFFSCTNAHDTGLLSCSSAFFVTLLVGNTGFLGLLCAWGIETKLEMDGLGAGHLENEVNIIQ